MDPKELSNQLMKPTGDTGREIADALNESNSGLYDLAFKYMNLSAGHSVLEIGFGNGKHFNRYFEQEKDLRITGIDYSEDMCKAAIRNNTILINKEKLDILCAATSSLPFEAQTFDLIVAVNVIYFLNPPEVHLKEIHRVLKPGGKFLIGFRPRHSVEHFDFTKTNFTLYEMNELENLLSVNNFKLFDKNTRVHQKTTVEGTEFTPTEACLIVQK